MIKVIDCYFKTSYLGYIWCHSIKDRYPVILHTILYKDITTKPVSIYDKNFKYKLGEE